MKFDKTVLSFNISFLNRELKFLPFCLKDSCLKCLQLPNIYKSRKIALFRMLSPGRPGHEKGVTPGVS